MQILRQAVSRWILYHPTGRWIFFGGCVGLLCGIAAAVFEICTDLVARAFLEGLCGLPALLAASTTDNINLASHVSLPLLLVVMTGGGLLAGLIIFRWSTSAKGGGTGVAVDAFHHKRGVIPVSTPWTKLAASIISLGSGGSGGREGPISLIGAGFGSWFAGYMGLTARDRRILLAAGIAGGIAAVFRAPLAAAIFAAEVLYRGPDLEADVLIPAFISAVVGYLVGTIGLDVLGPLVGHHAPLASSLFQPPAVAFRVGDWMQLGGYSLVAIACAVISRWFITLQRSSTHHFGQLGIPFWAKPALGAFGAGIIAIAIYLIADLALDSHDEARITLGVIGGGYGIMHWLFAGPAVTGNHHLIIAALLAMIALCKSATTALTVGSGGSAGLFGPCIVIGGCTGGALGFALIGLPISPPPSACILMGMAGVLTATHRTPVAALLMVSEIAGTWLLLIPAMWVCGIAFLLTGKRSIIGGQVDGLEDSPAHRSHFFSDMLSHATVRELPETEVPWRSIPAQSSITACRQMVQETYQDHFPVVRADGLLAGMLDRIEIYRLQPDLTLDGMVLAEDLAGGVGMALRLDDSLTDALRRFHHQRVEELPVIDATGKFIRMVSSGMVMSYYRTILDKVDVERKEEGESNRLRRVKSATEYA